MRTNSRPVARAIDSPIDVLPVPGGPISVRIAPDALVLGDAAVLAHLLDRDVLDDAVLDVLEAGVVGVEHLARDDRVQPLLGALLPRHLEQPVEVGPDRAGLPALLAEALEAAELLLGLLAHGLGHAGLFDLRAVLLDDGRVVVAELAPDGVHLAAQDVLALLLVGAGLHVVADAAADLELREALLLDGDGLLQALGDVERLEDPDLLLEGDVGRVADRVGQRAGLADGAQELGDAAVGAAQLEDLLDDGAVLALGGPGAAVDGHVVGALGDLDAQAALAVAVAGADDAARDAGQADGAAAAREPDAVGDLGDGADGGVLALVAGDQEHA